MIRGIAPPQCRESPVATPGAVDRGFRSGCHGAWAPHWLPWVAGSALAAMGHGFLLCAQRIVVSHAGCRSFRAAAHGSRNRSPGWRMFHVKHSVNDANSALVSRTCPRPDLDGRSEITVARGGESAAIAYGIAGSPAGWAVKAMPMVLAASRHVRDGLRLEPVTAGHSFHVKHHQLGRYRSRVMRSSNAHHPSPASLRGNVLCVGPRRSNRVVDTRR